ncbi:MAG: hypothetical protein O7I93_14010 [Gemmatimonadetes bacterium]|nr:hypothetical protein [Gemmatimonadota bacterium]
MGLRRLVGWLPVLLVAACGDAAGPGEMMPGPRVYVLSAIASFFDTDQFTCALQAAPILEYPLPPTITTTTQVRYERTGTAGNTFDPVLKARSVRQQLTVDLVGSDSVRVILGPPLADTLYGGLTETGIHSGDWTCGTDIPFAADSVLVGLGQDSTRVLHGVFGLQPNPGV